MLMLELVRYCVNFTIYPSGGAELITLNAYNEVEKQTSVIISDAYFAMMMQVIS
jgi:hypothetical protein